MAFYTEERLNQNRTLSDADFNVGFADYLGATIRDAWHDNPTVATVELGEVYTAQVGRDALADLMGDSYDMETDVSEFEPTASPALSLEDQQARIKEAGLEKHIKAQDGYNAEALNLVMDSKREELERQITRQAASDWYAPAGFITGLGTSMLDPINIASNFIPGVGQIRALRMLQEGAKQGAKGLALRRAVIGAAEGAAGSVVVEPLVALARSQQQADYGMTDSLLNVAFGTVMGATLHPAIGAWGDYKRRQAQKDNPLITAPWETVAPTDRTEELRHQLAQDAYARAQEAGSDMTEEQAYASAALFDARARTWAYFEKADPEEYYKQYRPEFEAELERMGDVEQGMYRNKADMRTFIENARNGMYDAHPSYVGMGEVIGGGHRFDGFELQLFSDNAKHTAKHEDNWENTLDIVTSGEFYDLKAKARTTGNESFLYYKRREDGKIDAVVVSPRSEKNKTLAVISSWKTNENGIEAVVQRAEEAAKRKAASVQPTGGSPAYPSQQRGALTGTETAFDDPSQTDAYILTGRGGESPHGLPTGYEGSLPLWERAQSNRSTEGTPSAVSGQNGVSDANIPQTGGDINTLLQRAWHGSLYDFDRFDLSFVGAGEGAQAHGYGLYVALTKKTANERYRKRLTEHVKPFVLSVDGAVMSMPEERVLDNIFMPGEVYELSAKELKSRAKEYLSAFEQELKDLEERAVPDDELLVETRRRVEVLSKLTNAKKIAKKKNKGQLFEVDIPEDSVMLDERADMEKQPAFVRDAAKRLYDSLFTPKTEEHIALEKRQQELGKKFAAIFKELQAAIDAAGIKYNMFTKDAFERAAEKASPELFKEYLELLKQSESLNTRMEAIGKADTPFEELTGHKFYGMLSQKLKGARNASLKLNEYGIKGIRYHGGIDGECAVLFDDQAIEVIDKLYQAMEGQTETPRGSVTFRPEDGKAVIKFFKNTDASTLPHEMFHIFRRELAETAAGEGASPQSRDMWAKVCEFVGAKEGELWTREQEEMFARAGERYLLEGKAPNAQLRGVFERMKQWFMEIYTGLDAAGMEISDTMRQVFGDMFKLSPEEADMAFRYSFGRMLEWDGTEGTDTAIPEMPDSDDPAIQEELNGLAVQRLEESFQSVADMPEVADAVRAQVEQEIAVLDAEMEQSRMQGEILLEAALCDMRS